MSGTSAKSGLGLKMARAAMQRLRGNQHAGTRAGLAQPMAAAASASQVTKTPAAGPTLQQQRLQLPEQNWHADITRHTFKRYLPVVKEAIAEANFVAIDGEFTGLYPEGIADHFLDDYEGRYAKLVRSTQEHVCCQFGLTAFKWIPAAPATSSTASAPASSSTAAAGNAATGTTAPISQGGYYEARSFNFWIFPQPQDDWNWDKRFAVSPSALAFLARQGFDFNRWIRDGISYLPLKSVMTQAKLSGLLEKEQNDKRGAEPRTPEERALVAQVRQDVRAWLMAPRSTDAATSIAVDGRQPQEDLLLPLPPTRRLRTLQRMAVAALLREHGSGDVAAVAAAAAADGSSSGCEAMDVAVEVVTTASTGSSMADAGSSVSGNDSDGDGLESVEGHLRLHRVRPGAATGLSLGRRPDELLEARGFSQVLEAITAAACPVALHNGSFDLAFTLAQFVGPLPREWAAAKALVRATFPGGLYDTKHLAGQIKGIMFPDTTLGVLYRRLRDAAWLRQQGLMQPAAAPAADAAAAVGAAAPAGPPDVLHAPGYGAYASIGDMDSDAKAHEAGFDSYMTGVVFARLAWMANARAGTSSSSSNSSAPAPAPAPPSASPRSETSSPEAPSPAAVVVVPGLGRVTSGPPPSSAPGSGTAAEAAAAPPPPGAACAQLLRGVLPHQGRIHFGRCADLPHLDVWGPDPTPQRPAVLHIGCWSYRGGREGAIAGLMRTFGDPGGTGPVQVCLLANSGSTRGGGGGGAINTTAAFVLFPNADAAARALRRVAHWRNELKQPINASTYSDYYAIRSKLAAAQAAGTPPPVRTPPRTIQTPPPPVGAQQQQGGGGGGLLASMRQQYSGSSGGGGGSGSSSSRSLDG